MKLIKIIATVALLSFNAAFAGPSLDDYSIVNLSSNGDRDDMCEAYVLSIKSGVNTKIKGSFLAKGVCVVSLPREEFSKKFEMCSLSSVKNNGAPTRGGCDFNMAATGGGMINIVEFSAEASGGRDGYSFSPYYSCKWACKSAAK